MAHSLALVRVLEQEFGTKIETVADAFVGHSLGEYSALTAAGVFSLADGVRLLRLRGQAMQQAVPKNIGAMVAILGLEFEQIAEIAKQATQSDNDFCTLANDNCSGQLVISGHKAAVERAMDLAKAQGSKAGFAFACFCAVSLRVDEDPPPIRCKKRWRKLQCKLLKSPFSPISLPRSRII